MKPITNLFYVTGMFILLVLSFLLLWISGLETTQNPKLFVALAIMCLVIILVVNAYVSYVTSRYREIAEDEEIEVTKRKGKKPIKADEQWLQN